MAPARATPRALLPARLLTLVVGTCAALPIIVATAAELKVGWQPVADRIVWVYDNRRLPVKGARVIARTQLRHGGRLHTVEVAISDAHPSPRPRLHRHR